jgi:hypothetical protein
MFTILYKLPLSTIIKFDSMLYNFYIYSNVKNPKTIIEQSADANRFNMFVEYWNTHINKNESVPVNMVHKPSKCGVVLKKVNSVNVSDKIVSISKNDYVLDIHANNSDSDNELDASQDNDKEHSISKQNHNPSISKSKFEILSYLTSRYSKSVYACKPDFEYDYSKYTDNSSYLSKYKHTHSSTYYKPSSNINNIEISEEKYSDDDVVYINQDNNTIKIVNTGLD